MQGISQSQQKVSRAQSDHIPWGWVALTVVALEIALVLSVAWVAIYSYLINPGHDLVLLPEPCSVRESDCVSCRWHALLILRVPLGRTQSGYPRRGYVLLRMVHLIHHRCVAAFAGRGHRVHLGNGGDFPCDENVGCLLWRQDRIKRCAKDPASRCLGKAHRFGESGPSNT